MLTTLWSDWVFALRQLRKTPVFTLIAILTLALGVGANTAVFSVMDSVLLRSLPVQQPDGLYHITNEEIPDHVFHTWEGEISLPTYLALRERHDIFQSLMAYVSLDFVAVPVRIGRAPFSAQGHEVSGNFFSGLTVGMHMGRAFTLDDEQSHTQNVVISYAFWTHAFSRDPHVIGSTLYIKNLPFTVIGVTNRGFFGADAGKSVDFWIPLQTNPTLNAFGINASRESLYGSPNFWCLSVIARLAPGVSAAHASEALISTYRESVRNTIGTPDVEIRKLKLTLVDAKGIQSYRDDYRRPIAVLMGLVILILAIAVTNVTLMINARNAARAREFSLRLSLGANRTRLFAQLLAESSILVAAGVVLGWQFAVVATKWLSVIAQIESGLAPNRTVLLFTLGVSAIAAFVFGFAPLRTATRVPMGQVLRSSGTQQTTNRRAVLVGNAALSMQVALCLVLLMAGSLLLRTLSRYQNQPLGRDAAHIFVFNLNPDRPDRTSTNYAFFQELVRRLRQEPGIRDASVSLTPFGDHEVNSQSYAVDGVDKPDALIFNLVDSGYFHAVGTPILEGREFTDADTPQAQPVVIVNRTFVDKMFPHSNPIGHRVKLQGDVDKVIIGVVADSKLTSAAEDPTPTAYFSLSSHTTLRLATVTVRTWGDPQAILPTVSRTVSAMDPQLPVIRPTTQMALYESSYAQPRMFATMGGFFGMLAALLVTTGLYGTLSYRTERRTSEIGIRMALGAQRSQVVWLIVRESLLLAAFGFGLGVPLLLLCSHMMSSMVWNLSPMDPVSFAIASLGVLLVTFVATAIPARRASSIHPMSALRAD